MNSGHERDSNAVDRLPAGIGSRYYYHPFEIAFCGYSNSGKTTLVKRLIERLADSFRIGYAKHQAHGFEMDRPGKDTDLAYRAGAFQVGIRDRWHTASIGRQPEMGFAQGTHFAACDFVFVEGGKDGPLPKIAVHNEIEDISPGCLAERNLETVVAVVGPSIEAPKELQKPYFHRDDIDGIAQFVLQRWTTLVNERPVFGLILAGSRGRRIGHDNTAWVYDGEPQLVRLAHAMRACCDDLFVSSPTGQCVEGELRIGLRPIRDRFVDLGPLGDILSAQRHEPGASWLVLACDLPFVQAQSLDLLLRHRDIFKVCTCFESADQQGVPEPLYAIYEPRSHLLLMQALGMGYASPREILSRSPIKVVDRGKRAG